MGRFAALFSFQGRTSRRGYRIAVFPINGVIFGILALIVFNEVGWIGWQLGLLLIAIFGVGVAANVALGVRRLHDLGRSGWWTLLYYALPAGVAFVLGQARTPAASALGSLVVLILPIIGFMEFSLRRGQDGPNRFGRDPMGRIDLATFD